MHALPSEGWERQGIKAICGRNGSRDLSEVCMTGPVRDVNCRLIEDAREEQHIPGAKQIAWGPGGATCSSPLRG